MDLRVERRARRADGRLPALPQRRASERVPRRRWGGRLHRARAEGGAHRVARPLASRRARARGRRAPGSRRRRRPGALPGAARGRPAAHRAAGIRRSQGARRRPAAQRRRGTRAAPRDLREPPLVGGRVRRGLRRDPRAPARRDALPASPPAASSGDPGALRRRARRDADRARLGRRLGRALAPPPGRPGLLRLREPDPKTRSTSSRAWKRPARGAPTAPPVARPGASCSSAARRPGAPERGGPSGAGSTARSRR